MCVVGGGGEIHSWPKRRELTVRCTTSTDTFTTLTPTAHGTWRKKRQGDCRTQKNRMPAAGKVDLGSSTHKISVKSLQWGMLGVAAFLAVVT